MATIKTHTDIPQSKKLAKFLPIESADMFWYRDAVITEVNPRIMNYMQVPELQSMYYSPCFSLTALLELLPRYIEIDGHTTYLDIYKTENLGWVIEYADNISDFVENAFNGQFLIDACYEMILKLHELNLL